MIPLIPWRDLGLLGAGVAAGLLIVANGRAAPPVVAPAPSSGPVAAPLPMPPMPPAPMPREQTWQPAQAQAAGAAGRCDESLIVTRLTDTTLVSVKDHCDSQTVLVYTFDERGTMRPSPQKLRFYYRF